MIAADSSLVIILSTALPMFWDSTGCNRASLCCLCVTCLENVLVLKLLVPRPIVFENFRSRHSLQNIKFLSESYINQWYLVHHFGWNFDGAFLVSLVSASLSPDSSLESTWSSSSALGSAVRSLGGSESKSSYITKYGVRDRREDRTVEQFTLKAPYTPPRGSHMSYNPNVHRVARKSTCCTPTARASISLYEIHHSAIFAQTDLKTGQFEFFMRNLRKCAALPDPWVCHQQRRCFSTTIFLRNT